MRLQVKRDPAGALLWARWTTGPLREILFSLLVLFLLVNGAINMFFGLMSLLIALEGTVDIVWSLGQGAVLVLVGAALLGSGRWLARGLRLTHHHRSRVLQLCGPRLRLHHADGRPFDLHAADLVSITLPRWGGRLILRDLGAGEHVLYVEGLSRAERVGLLSAL